MVKPQLRGILQKTTTGKSEKSEHVFQCTRCKICFTLNISAEDLGHVKCNRSCVAEVKDITEEYAKKIEQRRASRLERVAARERQYEEAAAEAKKQAEADARKRGR